MRTRIAVLVSGGGTNLQALIDAAARGELPHGELALVVSNNAEAFALERAKRAGIETALCLRAKGEPRRDFEARLLEILRDANTLGIGPMGLGGKTTLLGVRIAARPRVPAPFFVTIADMCWACRRGEGAI